MQKRTPIIISILIVLILIIASIVYSVIHLNQFSGEKEILQGIWDNEITLTDHSVYQYYPSNLARDESKYVVVYQATGDTPYVLSTFHGEKRFYSLVKAQEIITQNEMVTKRVITSEDTRFGESANLDPEDRIFVDASLSLEEYLENRTQHYETRFRIPLVLWFVVLPILGFLFIKLQAINQRLILNPNAPLVTKKDKKGNYDKTKDIKHLDKTLNPLLKSFGSKQTAGEILAEKASKKEPKGKKQAKSAGSYFFEPLVVTFIISIPISMREPLAKMFYKSEKTVVTMLENFATDIEFYFYSVVISLVLGILYILFAWVSVLTTDVNGKYVVARFARLPFLIIVVYFYMLITYGMFDIDDFSHIKTLKSHANAISAGETTTFDGYVYDPPFGARINSSLFPGVGNPEGYVEWLYVIDSQNGERVNVDIERFTSQALDDCTNVHETMEWINNSRDSEEKYIKLKTGLNMEQISDVELVGLLAEAEKFNPSDYLGFIEMFYDGKLPVYEFEYYEPLNLIVDFDVVH